MLGHNQRLVASHAGFQYATFVAWAAFVGAVNGQMNLNASDLTFMVTQRVGNFACGPSRQRLVTFDVMVGINLDLHGLFYWHFVGIPM